MGLWYKDGSLNLSQKTRPFNQQKQREFANLSNLLYRLSTEENWKCEKKDKYLDLARELKKKTMEHDGNDYTNRDWCIPYSN